MTKTRKGYDKIISVFFRKAYVGLKSISCITILLGLVVSSVVSGSGDPGFESHAILKKKNNNNNNSNIFILQWGKSIGNNFIRMQIRM